MKSISRLILVIFLNLIKFFIVLGRENCLSKEYISCGDNEPLNCISKEWWCDGNNDCESGRDELNCPQKTCLNNEFLCQSGTQCIPKLLQCDGTFHCLDKSDETTCKKIIKKSCNSLTEFDCNQDGSTCVPLSNVCDKKNDCGRNQDEEPGGSVNNCQRDNCRLIPNGGCSHFCTNFYTSIKCHCEVGYELLPDNKTCVEINECSAIPPKCSQTCENHLGGYKCSCSSGYRLDINNPGQCIAAGGDRSLLITLNGGRRLVIDLTTGLNHSTSPSKVLETITKTDVDLGHNPKMLFVTTEYKDGFIGKINLNLDFDKENQYRFLFKNSQSGDHNESLCTGLSFDWLRGLLFWTSAAKSRIYVTNTTSNVTSVLLNENLKNPRSIVADPFSAMLYWVNFGNNPSEVTIEMMSMDTENRKILLRTGLRQPLDLKIDFHDRKLYWSDINPGSINYMELRNPYSQPHVIISNKLLHPFSIAIFESKIYWTDWRQNQIISVNKETGSNYTVVAKVNKPFAIRVLHQLSQPKLEETQEKWHSCLMNKNHPCSHICLPSSPTNNMQNNQNIFRCLCSTNSILMKDKQSCFFPQSRKSAFAGSTSRYNIVVGVVISLIIILCLSFSIICVYICRQRSWAHSNKSQNRTFFKHPIVTGDLMFIFKCSSHSSQLSELLAADYNSTSTA